MRTRLAFCLLFFAAPLGLFAQAAAWTPVQGLGLGEHVEVKLFSHGGRLRGTVEQVSNETLVVRHKRGVATLDRADVRRVRIDSSSLPPYRGVRPEPETPRWNPGADVAYMVGSRYLLGWGLDGMVDDYRRKTVYKGLKR